jgi:hypothetical protein
MEEAALVATTRQSAADFLLAKWRRSAETPLRDLDHAALADGAVNRIDDLH